MTISYQKVWNTMNSLEETNTKLCNIKEILDASNEAIENRKYKRAEALNYAAYEYLEMIQNEFDDRFKKAWNETVKQINCPPMIENWTVSVELDPVSRDFYLTLPHDLCSSVDLKVGDEFNCHLSHDQDDKWILKKINNSYNL